MPYCSNCRTYIPDGVDTCPSCGTKDSRYTNTNTNTSTSMQSTRSSFSQSGNPFVRFFKKVLRTEDVTHMFDSSDISSNRNNAILAYLGPLMIIPLITSRKSKFAMFHFCQGLLNMIFGFLYILIAPELLNLLPGIIAILLLIPFFLFLSLFPISIILGIVHSVKGKAITLPIFGRINLMGKLFKNL